MIIRKTDPEIVLIDTGNIGASRILLLRAASYETVRHRTVLTLQQIKEVEIEIRTQRILIMSKKDGEG